MMGAIRSWSIQSSIILFMVLGVACVADQSVVIPRVGEQTSNVSQIQGRGNSLHTRQPDAFTFFFTMIFFINALMGLGTNVHGWVGRKPKRPTPPEKEPFRVTFEIGSDDGGKTPGRYLEGAGGQQPMVYLYDDKVREIGSSNETQWFEQNTMRQATVTPNDGMGGTPPKYMTLMARGNNPICIATVGVMSPPPDTRGWAFGAPTLMSCGLKWANSGRILYHNLTGVDYKPCVWIGSPFPEYVQVDLEFHTHDESRRGFYDELNKTENIQLMHEVFCNTPKNFHTRDEWPEPPYEDHIVWDNTVRGPNPDPVPQEVIRANMVNKTGLRPASAGMAEMPGYI